MYNFWGIGSITAPNPSKGTASKLLLTPNGRDVAAVVSAYSPTKELVENVASLKRYVEHVIVVDDGSPTDVSEILSDVESAGAKVLRLPENCGIAAALNAGMKRARELWEPEWLITMDQDSRFTGNYVEDALEVARSSSSPQTVGLVAPQFHNNIKMPLFGTSDEQEVFDPMQSGTLIKTSVLDRVGYLDEEFFIDCVDSEFNARVREAGFRALASAGSNLAHSLGDARPLKILGWHARIGQKKLSVHYHSPFRVYYITRNSFVLMRRYARSQPKWILRRLYMELQSHAVRFVYGPNRRKHLIGFLYGLRDGLINRMGKIDPRLAERLR
jgi:rhamnosyltransferase